MSALEAIIPQQQIFRPPDCIRKTKHCRETTSLFAIVANCNKFHALCSPVCAGTSPLRKACDLEYSRGHTFGFVLVCRHFCPHLARSFIADVASSGIPTWLNERRAAAKSFPPPSLSRPYTRRPRPLGERIKLPWFSMNASLPSGKVVLFFLSLYIRV